jgi:hypothetical protein
MIEVIGDIFEQKDADAICFTSNGIVKANGELVMGAGIAKAFRDRFPMLAKEAGMTVKKHGNHVHAFWALDEKDANPLFSSERIVFSFPTKHHFKDPSDVELIERSAKELVTFVNGLTLSPLNKIYLPRPGIGLGGLKWEDVKKVIEPILDDRFYIVNKE